MQLSDRTAFVLGISAIVVTMAVGTWYSGKRVDDLRSDMNERLTEVNQDVRGLGTDLRTDIRGLRTLILEIHKPQPAGVESDAE